MKNEPFATVLKNERVLLVRFRNLKGKGGKRVRYLPQRVIWSPRGKEQLTLLQLLARGEGDEEGVTGGSLKSKW